MVWLKDSVEAIGKSSSSLAIEEFEDDAIKKAHLEKDFIAFCSSTPGKKCPWASPMQKSTPPHTPTGVRICGTFNETCEEQVKRSSQLHL